MAEHGTRTRFNQGCTDGPDGKACDPCKQANRDYFRKYGQDKKAEKIASVTNLPTGPNTPEPTIGPCEAAVIAAVANSPAAEKRPDLVASARAMARLQDSPLYASQQAQAAKVQRDIMDELLKGAEKKSRLASVRQMTRPDSATG